MFNFISIDKIENIHQAKMNNIYLSIDNNGLS